MLKNSMKQAVLSWFTGKARDNAEHALGLLAESVNNGGWLPRASVKVWAALTKSNIAKKFAQNNRDVLPFDMYMVLYFGTNIERVSRLDFAALKDSAESPRHYACIEYTERFVRDFAPVIALVQELDATRPKPKFTSLGVSPTLTNTLQDLGVTGKLDTIRMCPMEFKKVERVNPKTGKKEIAFITILRWPASTVHHTSRFANEFCNCEACGHRIKNAFNWVPMLVDDNQGVPHSLWVGRDCAASLFGIEVSGEMEYENGPKA